MNRIKSIDFLKWVGVTGIILAHVGAPDWIMMLRSFDVPLMVILAGVLTQHSFNRFLTEGKSIISFFIHRAKRLIIPVWIFLVIYFFVCFMLGDPRREISYYFYSFSFTRYGIGYVWIILIYLYGMLLAPAIDNNKPSTKAILFISGIYYLYEVSYFLGIGIENKFVDSTFYYIVPYGVITYIGYYYNTMTKSVKNIISALSWLFFIISASYYYILHGGLQLVSIAKYPPRLYYLSYGLAWSLMLLRISEERDAKIYCNAFVEFVGSHTMWIYLWHILALRFYSVFHLPEVWYLKFAIVYSGSIIFTFFINEVLDALEKKKQLVVFLQYFRG